MIRLTSFLWLWFHCICPLMPALNTYHLTWVSVTLNMGNLFTAAPAKHSCCSLPWKRVERFYEGLQDLLELTPQKTSFHYRGVEGKSRKSRNTWSNRQIWPWSTEWAGQKLIEFCQENALVIANTLIQQHKRRLYTWTSSDGQHRNQIDYILCSQR